MVSERIKTEHSARLRLVHGEDCEGCQDVGVRMALQIVHLAGWRIVRTEDAGCYDSPEGFEFDEDEHREDWDRSGVFYEDERRPEGSRPLYLITDEWTPEGGAVAGEPEARWCAKHRDGWCAVAGDQEPPEGMDNVPTVCAHVVVLPGGFDHRTPTCPDCLTALQAGEPESEGTT